MTEAAARQLKGASDAAAPFETGGILLGVQAGGAPWITRVVELPTENRRSPATNCRAEPLRLRCWRAG